MKHHYTNISDIRQQIRQHPMLDEQSVINLLMTLSCRLATHDNQFVSNRASHIGDMLDDIIGYLETELEYQDAERYREWADAREKAYGRYA